MHTIINVCFKSLPPEHIPLEYQKKTQQLKDTDIYRDLIRSGGSIRHCTDDDVSFLSDLDSETSTLRYNSSFSQNSWSKESHFTLQSERKKYKIS